MPRLDRDRLALILCGVTVGFAALAVGGSTRWAALGATAGAIATASTYLTSRRTTTKRSPLLTLLAIATGLTVLQLLPMPAVIASLISSGKAELVADNARAWGEPAPAAVMASYDPPATLVELAKLCGYAALAFAAVRLSAQRRTRLGLAKIAVGAATAVALVSLFHRAVGATHLYGIFEAPVAEPLLSPLINNNHLASLTAMAVPLALGLAVASAGVTRTAGILAALICAATTLLTVSRGGAVGLCAGVVVVVVVLVVQRRSGAAHDGRRASASVVIPGIAIAVCAVALLAVFTATEVANEIAATRFDELSQPRSKFQIWGRAAAMLTENRWLGTGRGAFEPAFTRWAEVGDMTYSHAEDSYVQAAVDWGVPGAGALAIAAVLLVLAALRRWSNGPLEAGALGTLGALAVHDIADFSLEMPPIAMMAILAFAILVPARVGTDPTGDGRTKALAPRTLWLRSGLVAAALAVLALAASGLGRSARASATDPGTTPAQRLEQAAAASAHHPSDYLMMGRAAQALMLRRDPRAVDVIGRALYLNPYHSGLHRLAAAMLARSQRPSQAQVEFALALEFAPPPAVDEILDEVIATFPDPAAAARALPLLPRFAPRLIRSLDAHKRGLVTLAYTQRLAELNPKDAVAQLLCARAAVANGRGDLAVSTGRSAYELRPSAAAAAALAQGLALGGDARGAVATLRAALDSGVARVGSERFLLLSTAVDVQLAAGDLTAAAVTLDELETVADSDTARIAIHRRRAAVAERQGRANEAAVERAAIEELGGTP